MTTEIQDITTVSKFICNICDCVSIGNKGDPWVLQVFKQYPYSNCYTDRTAGKKAVAGDILVKGDGKKNTYIINMFTQFYPGLPKYANDSISRRLEWFGNCLDRLLEFPDIKSMSFPPDLGFNEVAPDHEDRFRNCINDFRKKYFLRYGQHLKLTDYLDHEIPSQSIMHMTPQYDAPISVLKTGSTVEDEPAVQINIIRKIDLQNLFWKGQSMPEMAQSKTKIPLKANAPVPAVAPKTIHPALVDTPVPVAIKAKIPLKTKPPSPKSTSPATPKVSVPKIKVEKPAIPPASSIETNQKTEEVSTQPEEVPAQPEEVPAQPEEEVEAEKAKVYDKNPLWTQSITELLAEADPSWDAILKDPKMMTIIAKLETDFQNELDTFGDALTFLPSPPELVFNALKLTHFPPKCVIVGQDPYFANVNEAMGLSFSVPDGVKLPPTLVNIYKELETDVSGFKAPKSGNLTKWAKQDVLLLNTALTVLHGHKEAHLKIWKDFTNELIKMITQKSPTPIVFMLWGNPAKEKEKQMMNTSKHLILKATHPSPLGASQGGWFGCKHFTQCNTFLTKNKLKPIDWKLT